MDEEDARREMSSLWTRRVLFGRRARRKREGRRSLPVSLAVSEQESAERGYQELHDNESSD